MKRRIEKRRMAGSKPQPSNWIDSHKWATKVEIQRLLSGKPDLIIEADPKTSDKQHQ